MTKEKIFTDIQAIVSDNPVLVIGSGASVPYHIPGMETLAKTLKSFFKTHKYANSDSTKAVSEFIDNLNNGMGLEDAFDIKNTIGHKKSEIAFYSTHLL